ncbi:MAG: NUDIX hydrolase [Phycisphaerae bacterium]|jgi:ADP-ribose pyrophosphatase|nr:NUDIX hydrolase [Phycisphaerae bacterium]
MKETTHDSGADRNVVWEGDYVRAVTHGRWEFVERKNITGIVGMIPVTDDGKLVLVAQHRPAVGRTVIELPAGLVGDIEDQRDEPIENAAARELIEETGYRAGKMERVCCGAASAGIASEEMTFFLATELQKVGPGGGDDSEDIVVHEVALSEAPAYLDDCRDKGMVIDLKIYAGLYFCSKCL